MASLLQTINLFFEQFIAIAVTFAIITTVTIIQARQNNKMLFFCKIIEKFFFFNIALLLSIPFTDPEISVKALISAKISIKISNKR